MGAALKRKVKFKIEDEVHENGTVSGFDSSSNTLVISDDETSVVLQPSRKECDILNWFISDADNDLDLTDVKAKPYTSGCL